MRRIGRLTHGLAGGLVAAGLAASVFADEPLVTFKSLSPETALDIAQAALEHCRGEGYQVAVAVVDRMGVTQVVIRDRFAGPHAVDGAERKAATATSFRNDTLTLASQTVAGSALSGVRAIDGVLMLGGGIPISASGSVVGGVGVAGAMTPEADHACAQAGIDAVSARLELAD